MCAGAWSQISKIVFGASDEHRGFVKWEHNYIQNRRKTGCFSGRSFRLDEALLLLKEMIFNDMPQYWCLNLSTRFN
jgi:tRNA(Arg) A34 adenosine deaminase TadA